MAAAAGDLRLITGYRGVTESYHSPVVNAAATVTSGTAVDRVAMTAIDGKDFSIRTRQRLVDASAGGVVFEYLGEQALALVLRHFFRVASRPEAGHGAAIGQPHVAKLRCRLRPLA